MNTFEHLKQHPIIAIIRRLPEEHTNFIIGALYEAGVRSIEVTADSENVLGIIKQAKETYKDIKVGVGTVLTVEMAEKAIDNGADFILSPVINKEVIKAVVARDRVMIPGAFTPTEALEAYEAGAQIIKVFPAGLLGPKFLKDMAGPLPFIPLAPTGGVNEDNLAEYLNAGAHCMGISSAIPSKIEAMDEVTKAHIVEKVSVLTKISAELRGVK